MSIFILFEAHISPTRGILTISKICSSIAAAAYPELPHVNVSSPLYTSENLQALAKHRRRTSASQLRHSSLHGVVSKFVCLPNHLDTFQWLRNINTLAKSTGDPVLGDQLDQSLVIVLHHPGRKCIHIGYGVPLEFPLAPAFSAEAFD